MRALLLDLDGTLLDSIELILTSFHHTSRTHLGEELPDSHWLGGIGTPLRDQLAAIVTPDADLATLLDTYITFNLDEHDRLAKPYPEVVEVVRELHRRGVPMALVTSKRRRGAVRGLTLLGLDDELPVRVCGDDVTHGKPHPEPVLNALDALAIRAEDAVFIGDSLHDIIAGKRAGVATGAVSWGPFPEETLRAAGPDYWFDSPQQWLEL